MLVVHYPQCVFPARGSPTRFLNSVLLTLLVLLLSDDFRGKIVIVADGGSVTVLRGCDQLKVRLNGNAMPDKRLIGNTVLYCKRLLNLF